METIFTVLCLTVALVTRSCVGLKCYSCINAEIGILSTNLNVNEECGSPTSETPVQSCPSDGKTYMCAYLESTSRAAFGLIKTKMQVRTCIAVDGFSTGPIGRCMAPDDTRESALKDVLGWADIGEDAKLCLCGTDACDNSSCDHWSLGNLCLPRWAPYVAAGCLVLIIIFVVVCCCRCCRGRR